MSDVSVDRHVDFNANCTLIETNISDIGNQWQAETGIASTSKKSILEALDTISLCLEPGAIKSHPISADDATKGLQVLTRLGEISSKFSDVSIQHKITDLIVKLNTFIGESVPQVNRSEINQPLQKGLDQKGEVTGRIYIPDIKASIIPQEESGVSQVGQTGADRESIPAQDGSLDTDVIKLYRAPESYKVSILDVKFDFKKAGFFTGKNSRLNEPALKKYIETVAYENANQLFELSDVYASYGNGLTLEKVLTSQIMLQMGSADYSISEAKANEYAKILIAVKDKVIDQVYGKRLCADNLVNSFLNTDIETFIGSDPGNEALDDHVVTKENIQCLDRNTLLGIKKLVMIQLSSENQQKAPGQLSPGEIKQKMVSTLHDELEKAVRKRYAIEQKEIIDLPKELVTTENKAQYLISELSHDITNIAKFVTVMNSLFDSLPGQEQIIPEGGNKAQGDALKEAFHKIFSTMNVTQISKLTMTYAQANSTYSERLFRMNSRLSIGANNEQIRGSNEKILHNLHSIGQFIGEYIHSEKFKTIMENESNADSDKTNIDNQHSKTDVMSNKKIKDLNFIKDFSNNLENWFIESSNQVRQINDNLALSSKTLLTESNMVPDLHSMSSQKEMQYIVDRIIAKMAAVEDKKDVEFSRIYDLIMAEVQAINESFKVDKMGQRERLELDDMISNLIANSLKKKKDIQLFDKLRQLVDKELSSERIEELTTVEIQESETGAVGAQILSATDVLTKISYVIKNIYQVNH